MALAPGARLGPYEVVAPLGAGGMGEVYRARDTKLGRDVAIKILPDVFAHETDRVARFTREAQTLAALNHPNIAQIYGIVEAPASPGSGASGAHVHALVMELVDGEDLSALIARRPVAVADALPIARQISDALEAAHEQGIIHRDLKPANIKVRADGTVKVLDFGLAKALDPAGASGAVDVVNSPTLTARATQMGVILGTAAYMAPEQARGKAVDKRADIWAFGVVLYEMLTGRRAFEGEGASDVLAAVLRQEMDWTALPPDTPAGVRRLLRRCLARDPRERLRDIGDARADLRDAPRPEAGEGVPALAPGITRGQAGTRGRLPAWLPWAVAAVAVALAAWSLWTRSPAVSVGSADGHFTIELPEAAPLVTLEIPGSSEGPLAVSPDGSQVVYVAPNGGSTRLYVRAMTDFIPRALPGTEGARAPFFSPDGRWIGFFAGGKLKKTPLAGGTPTILADAPNGCGASWSPSGEIVFAPGDATGLFIVSDAGGAPRAFTRLDFAAGDSSHRWPQWLPGGRAVLLTVVSWSRESSDIAVADLASGARRTVLEGRAFARYVPGAPGAASGHLVFVREGELVAARFTPDGPGTAGPPVVVVEGVRDGQFDVSASGALVFTPGSGAAPGFSLVWVDRTGKVSPINDLRRGYEDLHLSPDGRIVALTVEEDGWPSPAHTWLADTTRGTLTRFTFEGYSRDPVWMPDGRAIAFGSKRGPSGFGIYLKRLDGQAQAELLWASPTPIWPDPNSWTPDGRTLVFSTKSKQTGEDIWTLSLDGGRTAKPWLQTPAAEDAGRLSPDGHWIAYNSDESGRMEVYVQPFPGPGGKWLVSQGGGGFNAIWSRDGRRLFFRRGDQFLEADVDTSPGFTVGTPRVLFSGRYRYTGRDFDVSPDGTRLVLMRNDDARTAPRLNVVLNWWRALEARAKTGSS